MTAVRVQLALTIVWAFLFVPAVLWWKDSVPFLVWISCYANFVGHLSAYQAARAENVGFSDDDATEVLERLRALCDDKRTEKP